ncbi:hypothetical protein [Sedimenticola hydrogenitrophicus]|uniref:hypothetical protein n=1 Tax=Sedimenticola hydrogenitrophicus TaxID=2967975 RepID=UPI0021A7BB1C|nr:hypothetical protein [Sedimenticola hydrogenitrophicus]
MSAKTGKQTRLTKLRISDNLSIGLIEIGQAMRQVYMKSRVNIIKLVDGAINF